MTNRIHASIGAAAFALLAAAAAAAPALAADAPPPAPAHARVQPTPPPSPVQTRAERKSRRGDISPKAVVNAFNQMAFFDGDPIGAMKKYISDDFIERYPDFAKEGFASDKAAMMDFFQRRGWKKGEQNQDTIYQVLADGDRVMVFHNVKMKPGELGIAFVDIFRVRHGKIVEHWAVGQPVSDKVSPLHSMF